MSRLMIGIVASISVVLGGTQTSASEGGGYGEALAQDGTVEVRELPPPGGLLGPTAAIGSEPGALRLPQFQAEGTVPLATVVDDSSSLGTSVQTTTPSPPTLDTEIAALDNSANAGAGLLTANVPDPQVAAGPSHLLETVNFVGRIYDKHSLDEADTFRLMDLFGVPAPRCREGAAQPCWLDFDPRVLFDAISGRWVATYASHIDYPGTQADLARLHIAVSYSSDPEGFWRQYSRQYTNNLPDQPWIGITDDKITVSANLYDIDTFANVGVEVTAFNKAQMLSGGMVNAVVFPPKNPDLYFSIRPAQHMDADSDQIAAMIRGNSVTVFRYGGVPPSVAESEVNVPINGHNAPSSWAPSPGGLIDPGDGRLDDAFVDGGDLWLATATDCDYPPSWTFVCAQFIEIDLAAAAETQNIVLGAPDWYFFYPAARTDAAGNLIAVMGRSAVDIRPEARTAGRMPGDTPNLVSYSVTVHAGETNISEAAGARWGDYFGAARDPSGSGMCVWLVGEYAKDSSSEPGQRDWGTTIASATYSPYGGTCDDYDGDGYSDVAEEYQPLCGNSKNDDAFDAQGQDGVPDDGCPGGPPQVGAYSEAQFRIGTGATDPCGTNAWPADLASAGGFSYNKVNISDLSSYVGIPRHYGTSPGSPGFDPRWDLVPGTGALLGTWINVSDIQNVAFATAPMFGGVRMFGGPSCPW